MIDPGMITAIATTAGVVGIGTWRALTAFNSKADKEDYEKTKETLFKMMNADRADIGELNTNVAVMARDVQHLTSAVGVVSRNIEEMARNGRSE